MNRNLINRCSPTRVLSPLALIVLTGLASRWLARRPAHNHRSYGRRLQVARPPRADPASTTSRFRSRQAWDYGHTFVVFGRVGEAPSKKNVAGLSPKGDDPQMWLMGHYVPVPSDTGWTPRRQIHHLALP